MKRFVLLLLAVLPAFVFAQANYQAGYVLKNSGDTVKGYINYQEWAYSPLKIEFKINRTDPRPQQCDPETIKGFGVKGSETYASFVGLMSKSKNIFPDIPSNMDTSRQQSAVFIKQIVTGDHLTLYENSEVGRNSFFITEKNGATAELKYYEYYGATKSNEITDNVYRGQLILYVYKFDDGDKKLLSEIPAVKFEAPDLEDIVVGINNVALASKADSIRRAHQKSIVRGFAGAGLNSINSAGKETIKPRLGAGIDVFLNPDLQQFVFRTEAAYNSLGTQFTATVFGTNNTAVISYSGYYLTITPQILFNFYNKENFKIYVDGGFGFRFASYSSAGGSVTVSNSPTGFYIPFQVGMIINKRFEVSFMYTKLSTASYLGEGDKLTAGLGVRVFVN